MHALEILYSLGALDDDCRLTSPVGERLSDFPVEPKLAKCLLESWDRGCADEVVTIAAALSVKQVL